ncbi:hypothetical protein IAD21_04306 [Abditibacteriota bacterium]|nr:hypothetical protein IAD21_04306 [Abditibacteriota bacterium]
MNFHARSCALVGVSLGVLAPLVHSQTPPANSPPSRVSRPVMVPDARVLQLDDLGLYQLSYVRRGQSEQFFPVGWTGYFDETTGVACQPAAEQNGRRSWLLHPPWLGGVSGLSRQSFTFALPRANHIELKGAFAMRIANTEGSDGVTFRVKVAGQTMVDEHTKSTQWRDFSFDLSSYAGKTVTIAFESDAGPQTNSSFDFALWGNRQLVISGFTPSAISNSAPLALPLARLASAAKPDTGGTAPKGAYAGRQTVTVAAQKATLSYGGADGTFVYSWQPPRTDDGSPLGTLLLSARMKMGVGRLAPLVRLPLADDARIRWIDGTVLKLQSSRFEKSSTGVTLVSRYAGKDQTATVRFAARLVGKSLVFDVTCDQPLVRSFACGGWGPVMRRQPVATPYYTSSGNVYFLKKENLFVNAFNDWTASNATALENGRAIYNALTDGKYNRLRERAVFAPAWNLDEVLPTIPNPASPYLREVGGKLVLDIWGGNYLDIAKRLTQFHDYGLRDIVAIIHVWQRDGYDNGLPAHYPANAGLGGDAGMTQLVQTSTKLGYRIALHENYVDYYPNYEGFKDSDISLRSDSTKETAWYNEGTKMQSFAIQPNAILPLAQSQSPEIHRRYGTNANYLDVHSAVPPWFHVDARASEAGAGEFSTVFQTHRKLWAFERQTHRGPTFGEGNNHWFWSGLLDGAEAQVQNGWNTPLMVNFDLLKIHPLESNHGMGYYERWWDKTNWSGLPPMQVLDRYRMQTLAFGHAAFLGGATWNDLRLAWLEHNLMTPVTARYATARPVEISYWANGKWLDDSALARASASSNCVRVRYDNGLTLVSNADQTPMSVGGATLPQYGWRADGAGVTAYTAVRSGVTVDFAQTPISTFANARNASTWDTGPTARTRVAIADFAQTVPRRFRVNYQWTVGEKYDADNRIFVHFTNPASKEPSGIAFQDDHVPATPTSQWQPGSVINDGPREIRLPDDLKDGDYEMVTGLYNDNGRRQLAGEADSNGRARLGTLQVRNGGQTLTFVTPVDRSQQRRQIYTVGLNTQNKVIDFGSVRTDGSVMVRLEGTEWVLQTLPRDEKFVVELDSARFGRPKNVQTVGGPTTSSAIAPANGKFWRLPLNGAREYRWKAGDIKSQPKK